jgi:hypothetical protein
MSLPVLVPVHNATSSVRSNQVSAMLQIPSTVSCCTKHSSHPCYSFIPSTRVPSTYTEIPSKNIHCHARGRKTALTLTRTWYLGQLYACRPILPYGYAVMLAPAPALVHTCIPLRSTLSCCVGSRTRDGTSLLSLSLSH